MAKDFLEEVYQYSKVIYSLEHIVYNARKWRDGDALHELNAILPEVYGWIQAIVEQDVKFGKNLWESWKKCLQVEKDLVQLTDAIELEILPLFYAWMETISQIDVEEDGYALQSTRSGFLTLWYRDYYMHSCGDPMLEADYMAEAMYDPFKRDYYIYGCGLGYHVYQIYQRLKGFGKIVLFEPDPKVLEYAEAYGVLSWIPKQDLELRNFSSVKEFLEEADQCEAGLYIHVPSAHVILNEAEKQRVVERWMYQSTKRYMAEEGRKNAIRNMDLRLPDVSLLLEKLQGEEAVVIAAGPSINSWWDVLRSWVGKKRIIAVGTIYRRLLEEKIYPDMVVMIDPNPIMVRQLQGVEAMDIPLVLAKVAYWELARNYAGSKYMIYTEKERNIRYRDPREMWESGGTVSFTAMEIAIHLNSKKIYLVGLDLGYPADEMYAQGVTEKNNMVSSKVFDTKAVDGGTVKTDYHMDHYRKEIEKLISRHKDITFYNMSKKGALIRGTIPFEDEII